MGSGKHKRTKWSPSEHADPSNNYPQASSGETFAAIRCVDEAKRLCDRAEAVRVYAQRSGDYELQRKASEIRLFAAGRASELLAAMEIHPAPGSSGQARKHGAHRPGAHFDEPDGAAAQPVTLETSGVIKNLPMRRSHVSNGMGTVSTKNRVGVILYPWLHSLAIHLQALMRSLLSPRQWSQLPVLETPQRAKTGLKGTI
jgi:hypothetical protein